MIHLVTFASEDMSRSAGACVRSALAHGVETYQKFSPELIRDWPEVKANPNIFQNTRAHGYWSWKPLVIRTAMNQAQPGDYIIYSDAGIEFIDNPRYIIDRMFDDVWIFGNMFGHAHWCKRDIIDEIVPWCPDGEKLPCGIKKVGHGYEVPLHLAQWWLTQPWARFDKQAQASVIFFRVSERSRAFVQEWLNWCLFEGGRLVDDSPSRAPNHPEFQDNRHDQAILTTLAYRDRLPLHWWPATYRYESNGQTQQFTYSHEGYRDEGYPPLFYHHRKRDHEWN